MSLSAPYTAHDLPSFLEEQVSVEKSQDNYPNTLLDRAIRERLDCSLLFSLALALSVENNVC